MTIGRATALAFGELGMDVAVHYFRNADGASCTVAKLKEMGRKAEASHPVPRYIGNPLKTRYLVKPLADPDLDDHADFLTPE